MPTYDYQCTSCSHVFEIFQTMSEDPLKKCPYCGKGVRRLVSGGSGLIFKGSGFYLTDYVKKNNKEKSKPKADTPKAKRKESKLTQSEGKK